MVARAADAASPEGPTRTDAPSSKSNAKRKVSKVFRIQSLNPQTSTRLTGKRRDSSLHTWQTLRGWVVRPENPLAARGNARRDEVRIPWVLPTVGDGRWCRGARTSISNAIRERRTDATLVTTAMRTARMRGTVAVRGHGLNAVWRADQRAVRPWRVLAIALRFLADGVFGTDRLPSTS